MSSATLPGSPFQAREVFATPWFRLVAKHGNGFSEANPHYSISTLDYVSVVALTRDRQLVLVRQFRPAIEEETLELPSGHVEADEQPGDSAARELLEETGYRAGKMQLLGCLRPDTGRLGNKLWCYFASELEKDPSAPGEADIKVELVPAEAMSEWIREGKIDHSINISALMLAVTHGLL